MGRRPSIGVYTTYFDLTGTVRWGIGGRVLVFTRLTSTRHSQVGTRPGADPRNFSPIRALIDSGCAHIQCYNGGQLYYTVIRVTYIPVRQTRIQGGGARGHVPPRPLKNWLNK